jgi:hypothetical protein
VGRAQELPDAAGEVAFEAADGVALGLAFGLLACEVVAGLLVAAAARDGDAVDGGVVLAVAAAVQAMANGSAGADGDRGQAGGACELKSRRASRPATSDTTEASQATDRQPQ